MKKGTVIKILDSFEDEINIEKLIERVLFMDKVEKGLADAEKGKVYDYKDVKEKFATK